eukprot:1357285-Prymnesium_polylepis.1
MSCCRSNDAHTSRGGLMRSSYNTRTAIHSNRCTAIGTIEYNVGKVKGSHGGASEVHQGGQGVPCHPCVR